MDILRQYLPLSWFVGNPLTLTRSPRFLKHILIFYYSIELLMQINMIDDPLEAVSDVTFETLLTLLFVFIVLYLNSSLAWYVQVASALMVGESLIACVMLPIVAWITVTESTLSYVFLSILFFWLLFFVSYIFKQVLNINRFASIVIGIFYFIATYVGVFGINALLAL